MPVSTGAMAGRSPLGAWIAAGLTLCVGAVLIVVSFPRLLSSINLLPGRPILSAIEQGKKVSAGELDTLVTAQQTASNWTRSGRVSTDFALAQLLRSEAAGFNSTNGKVLLRDAHRALRQGLAVAPANPFAWLRLAYVEIADRGPSVNAANALQMSISSGEAEPFLLVARLELCFRVWDRFDANWRKRIENQVRRVPVRDLGKLAVVARRTGAEKLILRALQTKPRKLAVFKGRLKV